MFCIFSVGCSLYTRKTWWKNRIDKSSGWKKVCQPHKSRRLERSISLGAFTVAMPYILFLAYSHYQVPTFAWDTLWYWAPLAIDLLEGSALPQSGHPSFGAYGLAYFSHLSNGPTQGLLTFIQTTCGVAAVLLLSRCDDIAKITSATVVLCMSMPMFFQVYFNIGYFDLHVAVCMLIALIILMELTSETSLSQSLFGGLIVLALLGTALILKTTALIPVTCFLCVTFLVFTRRRTILLAGGITAPVIFFYLDRGFYLSILGREFSVDWERNPVMIVPGLWGGIFHDASLSDVVHNFEKAFFLNQSYSLTLIALCLVLFFRQSKRALAGDPRILMLLSLVVVEFALQATVPYFYENATADTRFTRSILIVPLISIALVVETILSEDSFSKRMVYQAQKLSARMAL